MMVVRANFKLYWYPMGTFWDYGIKWLSITIYFHFDHVRS